MRIRLLAIGERMPGWVDSGYREYARRLRAELSLELRELAPAKRGRTGNPTLWRQQEAERLCAALTPGAYRVALDEDGHCESTAALAQRMADWFAMGREINLLIGGPDGLAPELLGACDWRWSLSPLTFPHPLVRVILAEQLYRAYTVLKQHPYHRS